MLIEWAGALVSFRGTLSDWVVNCDFRQVKVPQGILAGFLIWLASCCKLDLL